MKETKKNELERFRRKDKKLQEANRERVQKYREKRAAEGKKNVTFLLSEGVHKKIKTRCKKKGLTQSEIAESIFRDFFNEINRMKRLKDRIVSVKKGQRNRKTWMPKSSE